MNLRVAGLTNSTKMVFNDQGIQEEDLKTLYTMANLLLRINLQKKLSIETLRNSVFVDVTANAKVVDIYEDLLKKV